MLPSRLPMRAAVLAALALAAVPLALAPARVSAATTFTVTTASDPSTPTSCPATSGSPCSLRAAVNAANSAGGTVIVDFGVAGPITLSQGLLLANGGETLTIQGDTAGTTVIDGGGISRILSIGATLNGQAVTCPTAVTTVTLSHLTLKNGDENTAAPDDGFGGAVDATCASTLSILDSTVEANQSSRGGGGVVDNSIATMTMLRSTVSGNGTGGPGGGIEVLDGANLLLVDSTVDANTSTQGGGGVFAAAGGSVTLVNDTIAANTDSQSPAPPGDAGGITAAANASFGVGNTIVSGNTPANCGGTLTDSGHNLEQGTSCGFTTNAINADPKLGSLQDNGGPAATMALQPGSPAIDAGGDTACNATPTASPPGAGKLDERSATRPQGTHCDIGAFEVVATTTQLSAPTTAAAGQPVTLVATVSPAQLIPGQPAGTVTFLDGTSVLGTGTLSGGAPDTASLATTVPSGGTAGLLARYEGSPDFLPSTSPAQSPAAPTPSPSGAPAGLIAAPNTGATPPPAGAPLLAGVGAAAALAATLGRRRRRRN